MKSTALSITEVGSRNLCHTCIFKMPVGQVQIWATLIKGERSMNLSLKHCTVNKIPKSFCNGDLAPSGKHYIFILVTKPYFPYPDNFPPGQFVTM